LSDEAAGKAQEESMNQPRPENISLAEFLVWEQQQADRYEWIDGTIVRCAGGSDEPNRSVFGALFVMVPERMNGGNAHGGLEFFNASWNCASIPERYVKRAV
jgi:Uma2 family endonuclease